MKTLTSLAVLVLAGGILAACDDAPIGKSNQGTSTPAASTTTTAPTVTAASAKEKWVWPGRVKDPTKLVIDSMQTRKNYVVVFDGSGSMGDKRCSGNQTKYGAGRDAVTKFGEAVPADANLGLVVFDNRGINVVVPLGTNNRAAFASAVANVAVGSGTPLKSSIRLGYDVLTKQGQSQFGYGTYSLIIVTDGEANSGESPTKIVNQIVDVTPVEIHTVGFCLSDRHELNQPGRTFYAAADSPEKLLEGLKDVLAETADASGEFEN